MTDRTPSHAIAGSGESKQATELPQDLTRDGPRLTLPNGLTLHLANRRQVSFARYTVREIIRDGAYARPGFEVRPTDTVVDIGANLGVFTLHAAALAPQGRILAIEPTGVMDCIQTSVRQNALENVCTVRCAVSDRSGTLDLLEYPRTSGINRAVGYRHSPLLYLGRLLRFGILHERPRTISVATKTLQAVLDEHDVERVDLLKIDCEGGEYDILEPPDSLDRVDRVVMEFHELSHDHDHRRLLDTLQKRGFECRVVKSWGWWFLRTGRIFGRRIRTAKQRGASSRGARGSPVEYRARAA